MDNAHIDIVMLTAFALFLLMAIVIILFALMHSRRMRKHNEELHAKAMEQERLMLDASIEAQEKERQRIGADIHDEIGPFLAGTKLLLNKFNYVKKPEEVDDLVGRLSDYQDEVIDKIREVSHNLLPHVLKEFGLESAVEELIQFMDKHSEVQTHFSYQLGDKRLSEKQELNIFRIIQEFCTNSLKYARAENIYIELFRSEGEITMNLRDDGIGFDTKKLKDNPGLGTKNIVARAKTIGATIDLHSTIGEGTSIDFSLKT